MAYVRLLSEADAEMDQLPVRERQAIRNAIEKLGQIGDGLGYPHSSQVQGSLLRELRPRAGRSPWRAFYQRQLDGTFIVAAIGPEAMHNRRGFDRTVILAERRLGSLEDV